MRALKVQVYDSETGRTRKERYTRSPVHIGRHPSNELCLSFGFVSGRHAQISFDEHGGTFMDLGSTNGSTVQGQRVGARESVPIGDGLSVTIGKLEMRFTWEEMDQPQAVPNNLEAGAPVPRSVPRFSTQAIPTVGEGTDRDPHQPSTIQQNLDAPPMLGGGPPMMDSRPGSGDGPPALSNDGPPALGNDGPPALSNDGPPALGNDGPPALGNAGGGPPRMDGGPPALGGGGGSAPPPPMLGGGGAPSSAPPALGSDAPPQLETPVADTEPPRRPGAEATGFVDLSGVHRAIRALRPAYQEIQTARQNFEASLQAELDKLPKTTRETAQAFLRREFPEMPGATPFTPAPSEGSSGETSSSVEGFATTILNDVAAPTSVEEEAAFLARIAEILQTTAQAFVEIRNVQARFGEEMGVRTIREFTPLHAAGDARNVLDYLLDWRRGGPERNAQLSAVYSDFMLHQVALINGVVEGVQGLMDQFRPAEIERGVGGLNKSAAAWKKYMERYGEVVEDRGIAALVFGPEFARAYAEVGSG